MLTLVVWRLSYRRLTLKIVFEMECEMGRHICARHVWATALHGIDSTTRRSALQLDVTLAFSIRSWTSRHLHRPRGAVRRLFSSGSLGGESKDNRETGFVPPPFSRQRHLAMKLVRVYDATRRFLRLWTFLLLEDLLDGQL
jgi:hypothetical protein